MMVGSMRKGQDGSTPGGGQGLVWGRAEGSMNGYVRYFLPDAESLSLKGDKIS